MNRKEEFETKVLQQFNQVAKVISYKNAKTDAILECNKGHKWAVNPSNLLHKGTGSTCPGCALSARYSLIDGVYRFGKTNNVFVEQLSAITTSITLVSEYKNAYTPVQLKCICGNEWQAIPSNILSRGITCTNCNTSAQSIEQAEAKIKLKYPQLNLLEYHNSSTECVVLDTTCGHSFNAWYSNLVQGKGYRCTTCVPEYGTSKNERAIADFIRKHYNGWIECNNRELIPPKEIDILLPDLGIGIEYNSPYTHHNKDHLIKLQQVEALGFRLLQLEEYEWNNKQEIVKSKLLTILGKNTKIYARKCSISRIPFPSKFLEENHLQGAGQPTTINYGLFLDSELVAVMTFGQPRFTNDYDYELIRFCTLKNVTVIGGASKLLKEFTRTYPNKTILSYSDRRWSTGNLYKELGFTHSHSTPPGYAYYKNNIRLSRYQCQKHLLKDKFPKHYDENLSETEIMHRAGFSKMFDCGMDVWVYNV